MNIGSLFQNIHEQLYLRDLIQITPENFDELKKSFRITESYEEVRERFLKYDMDAEKLYVRKGGYSLFWYIQENAYTELYTLGEEEFIFMRIGERAAAQENHLKTFREKGDYKGYFTALYLMAPTFMFYTYERLFAEIPKELKYDIFREMYFTAEYGFKKLDKNIVQETFKLNKDKSFKEALEPDEDGYLTIYRGVGKSSTNTEDAYSWTLSPQTALSFASKFSVNEGTVLKARIHIDNVIDYIDDRNEKEILVHFEAIEDIEDLGLNVKR